MRGIGEVLSAPLDLPGLPALLVNPGVAVPTRDVFDALHRHPEVRAKRALKDDGPLSSVQRPSSFEARPAGSHLRMTDFMQALVDCRNDLEAPAIVIKPVIADTLRRLRRLDGCRLARMSGSGATCFGLFDTRRAATAAARALREQKPRWWIRPTVLG